MLAPLSDFDKLAALGYTRLIPIIPPDAPISAGSSLAARVGTHQDGRGKTPGIRGRGGEWFGFDWVPCEADEHDYRRWHDMGAGVGIKTGGGLYAIDADTMSEEHARTIRDMIARHFGATPVRVGRYPKALYLLRVEAAGELPYMRVEFGEPDARGIPERVELLGDKRQFVAHGVHPKTRQPYTWPVPLVAFDELPVSSPETIADFMQALRSVLPAARPLITEGTGAPVNQAALRGDPAAVRRAVAAIPNTSSHFPSRESYLHVGYAIKAALEDDHEAYETWADWCDRWADGTNDHEIMQADWRRMKPPFKRGASWLYDTAAAIGGFDPATVHFDPIAEPERSPFDVQHHETAASADADMFPVLTVTDLVVRPPPVFLIDRHLPEKGVGFFYADPGAGKSFIAMDMGLHIAHGRPDWQGESISARDGATTLYLAAEGSFDLRNRILAWHKHHALPFTDRFLVIEQSIDFMQQADIAKLLRTIRSTGVAPALVVVDTVSRMLPGADENTQKDMTLFVAACDRVRDAFGCAVMGVHHAGKAGDMRGSTVLRGAGDFVMRLDRRRGATIGTLTMEKQKGAPDGWDYQVEMLTVELDDGQSSLVPVRAAMGIGGDLTPASASAVFGAMQAAWDDGEPWSSAPRSKERYAVRRLAADFGYRADQAQEMLRIWIASGVVEDRLRDPKRKLRGLRPVQRDGLAYVETERDGDGGGVFG